VPRLGHGNRQTLSWRAWESVRWRTHRCDPRAPNGSGRHLAL